jgi:hypothetical protein
MATNGGRAPAPEERDHSLEPIAVTGGVLGQLRTIWARHPAPGEAIVVDSTRGPRTNEHTLTSLGYPRPMQAVYLRDHYEVWQVSRLPAFRGIASGPGDVALLTHASLDVSPGDTIALE